MKFYLFRASSTYKTRGEVSASPSFCSVFKVGEILKKQKVILKEKWDKVEV